MRLVSDERGSSQSIEFLIVGVMSLIIVCLAISYNLVQVEQQQCEHLSNYYLARMRVEGYLTSDDEDEMIARFASIGMQVQSIDAPRESLGDPRILRTTNPDGEEVWLTIVVMPNENPLKTGSFIGNSSTETLTFTVGGRAKSERIDP